MLRFLLAAAVPFAALLCAVSCDTGAKGINECRQMETARCVAARSCDLGVDSDDREAVCKRFARDNCLHGVSTGVEPKPAEVEDCTRVIKKAGECAEESGGDQPAADCAGIGDLQSDVSVCELVEDPTQAFACAWLLEDPPEPPEPPEDGG